MFKKVAFIGAGSMAEAIISGMIQTSFLQREQIFVTNKNNQERLDRLSERYKIQCSQDKADVLRSEERRVGKECRSRWWPDDEKKKEENRSETRVCKK